MTPLMYGLLASILAFVVWPSEDTVMIVAAIMALFATIFYYYVTAVMMTLKDIQFNFDGQFSEMWQIRTVLLMAMSILYTQGQIEVFYYIMPFFVIGLIGDIFSSMIMIGYITLEASDPDDPEE
jgi:hypothetical protein|tara:strand:- start:887 stop:1258 length:372 start_codon:yes stop_codon:yes gene_type:complete